MAVEFMGDFIFSYSDDDYSAGICRIADSYLVEEIMKKHYEFFREISEENEYVTKGSILWCSGGTQLSRFDLLMDHGVENEQGIPLGICSDCKENENIYSFGGCRKPAPKGYPERERIIVSRAVSGTVSIEKCIPMLGKGGWQKTDVKK